MFLLLLAVSRGWTGAMTCYFASVWMFFDAQVPRLSLFRGYILGVLCMWGSILFDISIMLYLPVDLTKRPFLLFCMYSSLCNNSVRLSPCKGDIGSIANYIDISTAYSLDCHCIYVFDDCIHCYIEQYWVKWILLTYLGGIFISSVNARAVIIRILMFLSMSLISSLISCGNFFPPV